MSSTLLRVMVKQPEILLDHVQAYAELFEAELETLGTAYSRRIYLKTVMVCCLAIGLTLTGFALMLVVMLPPAEATRLWVLALIPLVPLAACLWCLVALRSGAAIPFEVLRRQITADIYMLRGVAAP
jgi:pilus assembly protein TadC